MTEQPAGEDVLAGLDFASPCQGFDPLGGWTHPVKSEAPPAEYIVRVLMPCGCPKSLFLWLSCAVCLSVLSRPDTVWGCPANHAAYGPAIQWTFLEPI